MGRFEGNLEVGRQLVSVLKAETGSNKTFFRAMLSWWLRLRWMPEKLELTWQKLALDTLRRLSFCKGWTQEACKIATWCFKVGLMLTVGWLCMLENKAETHKLHSWSFETPCKGFKSFRWLFWECSSSEPNWNSSAGKGMLPYVALGKNWLGISVRQSLEQKYDTEEWIIRTHCLVVCVWKAARALGRSGMLWRSSWGWLSWYSFMQSLLRERELNLHCVELIKMLVPFLS